ncbi:branched-chain amino acid ABC transporter permease [Thermobifida alba]|uniref:Branched-chain amino acid ABC transporter permease n=1 Tax=Thermobifida alba TaxID=53522 RepID=A0ABY4L340_THEAE|nr:branched-chain amino acid ABC transporter permease [Thermobifida alba]UPT22096.1 branched-chain amino acid ABC transporter permease [Thermobifida alba]
MSGWYGANLILVQNTFIGLVLALSIQFPMRMGVFSFTGAGSYGLGAYLAAILVIDHRFPALAAIAAAMAVSLVVSVLLGLLVQQLDGLYLGMATIAFCLIVSVAATAGGDLTGGPTGRFGAISDFTSGHIYVIAVAALLLVALTEFGRVGRRIEAVREDPELAAAVGINVRAYRLAAFAASGLLGGCAGAMNLLARTTITPVDIGFSLVILALTMIIVGGIRSWKGALIGAVVFTWLPELLAVVGKWEHVVYGALVAAAAIWMPGGLYGVWSDAKYRYRVGRRKAPSGADRSGPQTGAPELRTVGEGVAEP